MHRRKNLARLVLLVAVSGLALIAVGCSRDPSVRKRKYLQSAQEYFDKGENREAMIQYMNAVQLDPQSAEAHYGLAQVHLRQGAWTSAFSELTRTIELQPENLKAQIDLGNLQLAAHDLKAAMDKAELVLAKDPNNVGGYVLKANVHADALLHASQSPG
jgi:Tfp pilus assembly protein PilF